MPTIDMQTVRAHGPWDVVDGMHGAIRPPHPLYLYAQPYSLYAESVIVALVSDVHHRHADGSIGRSDLEAWTRAMYTTYLQAV